MRYEDGGGYSLGEFVIMPNHVHVLLHVPDGGELSTILQAWKSISARKINSVLRRRGSLWQTEPFDHIVRDASHYRRFVPGTFRRIRRGLLGEALPLGVAVLK